jgi:polar amino acid transport system substrate-binding protein
MTGLMRWLVSVVLIFVASLATAAEPRVVIPNYWEPRIRLAKPDTSSLRVIRFLTDDEYPPLHFADADGALTGFSVDLARAACEKLALTCTLQARRFDTLADSLAEGRGDVLAAAIPVTPALRKRFAATAVYHRTPARFVAPGQSAVPELTPDLLKGKRVGVVGGTAHEAFLIRYMPEAGRRVSTDLNAALLALRDREVDYVFGDGLALAIWLGGRAGSGHAFAGQPYLESRYFGEGIGFIVRPEDVVLRRALDYAMQLLWDDGTYARLYLRYFPVSLY